MAKDKPGIVMYWGMFDMLDRVKPEKVKPLLKAIRNLAQYGEFPDFGGDEALELVWPLIEQQVIADSARYEKVRQQRVNAINARWEKERAKSSEVYERIQPYTGVYEEERNIPITNTNTDTNTKTETKRESKPAPTRHKYGEYSNVLLSDEDMGKLKTEFPEDWQKRIERLSEYIASTGKAYKNHLATLRAWAKKDKEETKGVKPDAKPKSLADEWGGDIPACFRTIKVD